MTTQDQSRADFEAAWQKKPGVTKPPARFPNGGDYIYPAANTAWWAWQAARALPQGNDALLPIAMKSHGAWDGLEELLAVPDGTEVYTAAQVQAMGRVPPGWQAVPLDLTPYQLHRVAMRFPFDVPYLQRLYADLLSAALPALSADELKDLLCPKNWTS